ncbi:phosphate ABC transporter substrate-binding protein, PhoT family [Adhaeribacter arboris]|uniref:Phosphate ABC transporter substrate-binding protein, PhoT family n=1 Tax=Adhaeribacter arboris TaxID=2072846 RepID=A0A2T2YKJ8_9BACT|nr:substrate-binding domain-containing protein [Adhaeribacter arboris]PSR55995.1 phosphate ABC transporter substrate-binding protein, PhoT family [Adhaeribacter arboris]
MKNSVILKLYWKWMVCLLLAAGIFACNREGKIEDTPTSGNIKISVDEAFAPIIDSHIYAFQKFYKYAKINATYKSEAETVKDLLQDSARLVVISRPLTNEEKKVFEQQKITPRITKIAIDGIALITHPSNPDTTFTMEEVRNIFSGKVSSWKQLDPGSILSDITIVFDNAGSSTARYITDSVINKQPLPKKVFAAKTNKALIDYVAQNPNALGVIGVNWISDFDDSTSIGFLRKIKVAAVSSNPDKEVTDAYVQPFQGYLAQKSYPLRRNVYIVSREARAGLGTGFASFVAGDKGQRIVLKSGLVPASVPVRIISIKE